MIAAAGRGLASSRAGWYALLCTLPALACSADEAGPADVPGPAARIELVSGNDQEGTVGNALPAPIRVRVVDADGAGVPNVLVVFDPASGNTGTFEDPARRTDADGHAEARWHLPVVARAVSAAVRVEGVPVLLIAATGKADEHTAVIRLSAEEAAVFSAGPHGDATVQVVVRDRFDNPVVGRTVQFTPDAQHGTVSSTERVTGADGAASVTWRPPEAAGSYRLRVRSGAAVERVAEAAVFGPDTPSRLAMGMETACAIGPDARLACWGSNAGGAVGDGTQIDRPAPVAVAPALRWKQVEQKGWAGCGVTAADELWCWGFGRQTGYGGLVPTRVTGLPPVRSVGLGNEHLCAVAIDGRLFCAGSNRSGQLGDGTLTDRSTMIQIGGALRFRAVAGRWQYTCAIAEAGELYCWGSTSWDAIPTTLPIGGSGHIPTPQRIGALRFDRLAIGESHQCARAIGGAWYCWGYNIEGQALAGGAVGLVPVTALPVAGGALTTVAAGFRVGCGLTFTGQAICWGDDLNAALGDAANSGIRRTAAPVDGGLAFTDLGMTWAMACGLTAANEVYCWGTGHPGAFGIPGAPSSSVPSLVLGPGSWP